MDKMDDVQQTGAYLAKINIRPTRVEIPLHKNINQDVIGSDINNKTHTESFCYGQKTSHLISQEK